MFMCMYCRLARRTLARWQSCESPVNSEFNAFGMCPCCLCLCARLRDRLHGVGGDGDDDCAPGWTSIRCIHASTWPTCASNLPPPSVFRRGVSLLSHTWSIATAQRVSVAQLSRRVWSRSSAIASAFTLGLSPSLALRAGRLWVNDRLGVLSQSVL